MPPSMQIFSPVIKPALSELRNITIEAMSSGLVPVTNAVTAIPEFVDESCGILASGEDYMGMAVGIEKLYKNPELFAQLSKNAATRVRKQTSKEFTIDKEIELIIH